MSRSRCGKLGDLLNKVSVSNEKVQQWKYKKDLVSFSYKDWYKFIEHNKAFKMFDNIIEDIKNNYTYLDHTSVYSCLSKIREHKLVFPDGIEVVWDNKKHIWEIKNVIECNKSESLLALIHSSDNIKPISVEITKLLTDSLNLSNKKTIKLLEGLINNITQNDDTLIEIKGEFHDLLGKLEKALMGGVNEKE